VQAFVQPDTAFHEEHSANQEQRYDGDDGGGAPDWKRAALRWRRGTAALHARHKHSPDAPKTVSSRLRRALQAAQMALTT